MQNGKPANHALAKEIIAGIAGAEADKLFETKGLDFIDRGCTLGGAVRRWMVD